METYIRFTLLGSEAALSLCKGCKQHLSTVAGRILHNEKCGRGGERSYPTFPELDGAAKWLNPRYHGRVEELEAKMKARPYA